MTNRQLPWIALCLGLGLLYPSSYLGFRWYLTRTVASTTPPSPITITFIDSTRYGPLFGVVFRPLIFADYWLTGQRLSTKRHTDHSVQLLVLPPR